MSKIIIKNRSKLDDRLAMRKVECVIDGGLVSEGRYGKQYCFASVFDDRVVVYADKTKTGTHVFTVASVK